MLQSGVVQIASLLQIHLATFYYGCLLYTSDAADERSSVDLGGRRIIKKKKRYEISGGARAGEEDTQKEESHEINTKNERRGEERGQE